MSSWKRNDWIAFAPGILFLFFLVIAGQIVGGFIYEKKESHLAFLAATLFYGILSFAFYRIAFLKRFGIAVSDKARRQTLVGIYISVVVFCAAVYIYWQRFG